VPGGKGPVDEQEVDVLEPHPVEGRAQAVDRAVTALEGPVELRRDEELLARDAAAADALRDTGLVAVAGRGVDVAIAGLRRCGDGVGDRGVVERPRAETELRDRGAGVEGDARDAHP